MRLTLEPSHGDAPRVTIETAHDDLDVIDVMELVRAALLAYGYQPVTRHVKNDPEPLAMASNE